MFSPTNTKRKRLRNRNHGIRTGHVHRPPGHAEAVPADILERYPAGQGAAPPRRRTLSSSTSGSASGAGQGADRPPGQHDRGLFTVEYPDERLPVYERFRVLPVLIYDTEDGNVRCTSCNICAKVCPPQCIWMTQAKGPKGTVVPLARGFLHRHGRLHELRALLRVLPVRRDQDGPQLRAVELRAAPDAHLQPCRTCWSRASIYAKTHPEAWNSADEVAERNKVAKKKDQRLQKALAASSAKAAPSARAVRPPRPSNR